MISRSTAPLESPSVGPSQSGGGNWPNALGVARPAWLARPHGRKGDSEMRGNSHGGPLSVRGNLGGGAGCVSMRPASDDMEASMLVGIGPGRSSVSSVAPAVWRLTRGRRPRSPWARRRQRRRPGGGTRRGHTQPPSPWSQGSGAGAKRNSHYAEEVAVVRSASWPVRVHRNIRRCGRTEESSKVSALCEDGVRERSDREDSAQREREKDATTVATASRQTGRRLSVAASPIPLAACARMLDGGRGGSFKAWGWVRANIGCGLGWLSLSRMCSVVRADMELHGV